MSMWSKLIVSGPLCLFVLSCFAQGGEGRRKEPKGEFTGLIKLGICASQIHGDGFGGYNKFNLTGGVGTYTRIGQNLKFQTELNYCGRGSRKRLNDRASTSLSRIGIHYIDVPLMLKFFVSKFEFEAGLTNAFMVASYEEHNFAGRLPDFNRTYRPNRYELAANVGIYIPINEKWVGSVRLHYSVLPAFGGYRYLGGGMIVGGDFNNALSFTIVRTITSK